MKSIQTQCHYCKKMFLKPKKEHDKASRRGYLTTCCSRKCKHLLLGLSNRTAVRKSCALCGVEVMVLPSQLSNRKSPNFFCSRNHAASYNNKHRKTGIKRSKAESYLSARLHALHIDHVCNDRSLLPSGLEIDLLLESKKLAIELNGPVHYIPMFGKKKLTDVQNKDQVKAQELKNLGYDLLVVDVSQSRFKDTVEVLEQIVERVS